MSVSRVRALWAAIRALFFALVSLTASPALAGSDVLVIWDVNDANTTALRDALTSAGMTVTLSTTAETGYDGTNPSLSGFDVVILLDGQSYSADMPAAGQSAIDTFVRTNGGGFVMGEWIGWEVKNHSRYAGLSELVLFTHGTAYTPCTLTITEVSAYSSHTILANVASSFSFSAGSGVNTAKSFSSSPVATLANITSHSCTTSGIPSPAILTRDIGGRGRSVNFAFTNNYGANELQNATVQQLYIDAVRWASCDVDQDGVMSSSCYGGTDCNDSDATVSASTTWYRDADGDKYGTSSSTTSTCSSTAPTGYVSNASDCNDASSSIRPGAAEVCDGVDQDCDGTADDGLTVYTYYKDGDGDGYGTLSSTTSSCSTTPPSGYSNVSTDCDDTTSAIRPGATETCNSKDDDCDGTIDEGVKSTYYRDADGDGYGTSSSSTTACSAPSGYVANSTDCDDTSSAIRPGGTETCNSKDDDCDGSVDEGLGSTWYADDDGDTYGNASVSTVACSPPTGYVANADDCDDTKGTIYPGAPEALNGIDDDCDGSVDEGTTGTDDDGDGYTESGGDCDDSSDVIYPGAPEVCDGVDEDCDGTADDGTDCYDDDGDGYDESQGDCDDANADRSPGLAEVLENGVDDDCDGIVDEGGINDPDEDGYSETGGDCEPDDGTVYPGAPELEDGKDNDCDDTIDEGTDVYDDDGDGFTEDEGDCDDADDAINPDATESADGIDEDCDGVVDQGTDAYDDDGDGYSEDGGDCDDADDAVNPGASEEPNEIDDNCDGTVDEGTDDFDGDGFAVGDGDCDDENELVYPSAYEICDSVDNDCNGASDDNPVCESGDKGCGCSVAGSGTLPLLVPLLGLALARRRRR